MIEALVLFVVVFLLQELMRPKPKVENAKPAGLGDFDFPTATEGRFAPVVFGRVMSAGPNVTWYGNLKQDPITKKVQKNLWSSFRAIVGYKYHVGVQFDISRGPVTAWRRIWIGDVEVWSGNLTADGTIDIDLPDLFGGDDTGNGGVRARLDVYLGSSTQAPNEYLSLFQAGVLAEQPIYGGFSYCVARELGTLSTTSPKGAYVGNSAAVQPWKFEVERYPGLFSGQTAGQNKIGDDCNLANVIYEYLTNTEWGLGESPADIDVGFNIVGGSPVPSSFLAASTTFIAEGNGFSMLLTSDMEGDEFLKLLEQQMGGVVYIDQATAKWKIKLARADYDILTVPHLNEDNSRVVEFEQGTWENTTNSVSTEFNNRANDYKLGYGSAQDTANMLMQGGSTFGTLKVLPARKKYPGCKDADLANDLAWRDLRLLSTPLARVSLITNRAYWDRLNLAHVFAWSDEEKGFDHLPMRIIKVNYGTPEKNEIRVWAVQDVFSYEEGSFAAPPTTAWTLPATTLVAYPSAQQLAFEAPRAVVVRDPEFAGDAAIAKIMAAVRQQTSEVAARITQRNAAGATSGPYFDAGDVAGFMRIGKLQAALTAGVANPTASITIVPDPDSQTALEELFDDGISLSELGVDLAHLIMVGNEFMLVRSASNSGGNVALANVYRGVLDSGQEPHAANDPVYLLFIGSALSDAIIANTNNVDVELRARSAGTMFGGAVTTISFAMAKRTLRPYPAAALLYNGSGTPFATPSLEGAGAGIGGFRLDVAWWRRRYDPTDEIAAITADDAGVLATTEYQLEVRADPTGANTLVLTSAWTAHGAAPIQVLRTLILTAAPAGTALRMFLKTRHDIGAEVDLESRHRLQDDVTPTSALTGKFYLGGGLGTNVASAQYPGGGTAYRVNIGTAYATGSVEYDLNASGVWTVVVAAGVTTGTFVALAGDTVRLRRTAVTGGAAPQFVELRDETGAPVVVAYGTFS